jgi:hypothetical protein
LRGGVARDVGGGRGGRRGDHASRKRCRYGFRTVGSGPPAPTVVVVLDTVV